MKGTNLEIINDKLDVGIDFGKDIIPELIKSNYNIFGFKLDNNIVVIDTPELLEKQLTIN